MPDAAIMPQEARRFLDFLVCGLPTHKREGRLIAAFGGFADDSGSHAQSPIMILAAVVAKHDAWKQYSDKWWDALVSDKSLRKYNGHIYFKSSEAQALDRCFDGFTRAEADAKIEVLTDIILESMDYAMLSAIRWEHFARLQEVFRRPNGRLIRYLEHPYYMCFHDLLSSVLSEHAHRKLGEIDFAFDKQGKMLTRCIRDYDEQKAAYHPQMRTIAGQIIPGDDKVLLPIQGADLVAWQSRNRSWPYNKRPTTASAKKLIASKKIHYHAISLGELRYLVQWCHWTDATREMILRFSGYPTQIMQRVEPRDEN